MSRFFVSFCDIIYIGDFMIWKTLKYMRFKKNAKQEFISKKIGIERSTLSSYETERRQPDFNIVEKIANECDYEIYFINKKTGEKFRCQDIKRKDT